jgi:hypothetical protein
LKPLGPWISSLPRFRKKMNVLKALDTGKNSGRR